MRRLLVCERREECVTRARCSGGGCLGGTHLVCMYAYMQATCLSNNFITAGRIFSILSDSECSFE